MHELVFVSNFDARAVRVDSAGGWVVTRARCHCSAIAGEGRSSDRVWQYLGGIGSPVKETVHSYDSSSHMKRAS